MTKSEAIAIIRNEAECVRRADNCGRDCAVCELVKKDTDILAAYDMAIKALSADAVPVIHAEWIEDKYAFNHCSNCRYEMEEREYITPYCPNCGARMDD